MNFKVQSEQYLKSAQTRRRHPLSASTVERYQSILANHILPLFSGLDLAAVNNSALKTLVASMTAGDLSASTVNLAVAVVKEVVASAVNDEGDELYPRTWNLEFADVPVVDPNAQDAPVAVGKAISQAISRAEGEEKALYALLAGAGLRIDEARILKVGAESKESTWDPQSATIYLKANDAWAPKTEAGVREVDLAPELNDFLIRVLHPVDGRPVFQPVPDSTSRRRIAAAGLPPFHSLRRFRVTHLRKTAPEGLIRFWTGHANASVTDRYDKIRVDVAARKSAAEKAGLGFSL